MHRVLRHITIAVVVIAAFTAGQIVRDRFEAQRAEASSVSGSSQPGTGTGSLVGQTSPTLITPNIGVATGAQLTLTQGVSAVTGIFVSTNGTAVQATGQGTGHGLAAVGSATTASDAVRATAGNAGSESDAVHAIGANGVDSYALRAVGSGASGRGVRIDVSGGGYPLVIITDTTSPASPHMNLSPQTIPSACVDGDVSLQTGGYLRTCTGTNNYSAVSNTGLKSTVAAAGTNQATATAIGATEEWVTVTACDGAGTKAITLPTGSIARCVRVMAQSSTVTNYCNVYGHNSDNDTINGGAADAVYTQIAGSSLVYCTADGTAWFTY